MGHDSDKLTDLEFMLEILLECDDCGKVGEDVEETYCPYTEEIYDRKEEATLCKNCYQERCYEV